MGEKRVSKQLRGEARRGESSRVDRPQIPLLILIHKKKKEKKGKGAFPLEKEEEEEEEEEAKVFWLASTRVGGWVNIIRLKYREEYRRCRIIII